MDAVLSESKVYNRSIVALLYILCTSYVHLMYNIYTGHLLNISMFGSVTSSPLLVCLFSYCSVFYSSVFSVASPLLVCLFSYCSVLI